MGGDAQWCGSGSGSVGAVVEGCCCLGQEREGGHPFRPGVGNNKQLSDAGKVVVDDVGEEEEVV